MGTYTFGIPDFHITQIRSRDNDTLFASTGLYVNNANGGLHHDWGGQTVGIGNHKAGEDWPLELIWTNVDVPDPTSDNPDGGAVNWTFMLVNNGHHNADWAAVANKAMDAFASKMADGVFQGGTVTLVSLTGLVTLLGLQEMMNLLTSDCDGPVAVGTLAFTAAQLAGMVANANQTWDQTQDNPGTISPGGCGANSDYQVHYRVATTPSTTFQAGDDEHIFVLGANGNLWLEHAPFGTVPPSRQQVDGNVWSFQALDTQQILVLGSDGKLWLEQAPFGAVPPGRQQVDGNVRAFQALDNQTVMALGFDGKLWLETAPFGTVPPSRRQVDGNVRAFQGFDPQTALALGTDGNLWLETAPFGFGTVPPPRQQVDATVAAFQAINENNVLVLGTDGKLWLETAPFGTVPPSRRQVDGNVRAFAGKVVLDWVWVLGNDGNLWLEQGPFGTVPPSRQHMDGNVSAFQPIDLNDVLVLGSDGKLWLEHGPFGTVPPSRQQVDGDVRLPTA